LTIVKVAIFGGSKPGTAGVSVVIVLGPGMALCGLMVRIKMLKSDNYIDQTEQHHDFL